MESTTIADAGRHPKLLSVLVPSYQEARTLAVIVDRILLLDVESAGFVHEVIVCDDGSTDDTAIVVSDIAARDSRVTLLRHPRNRGKGAAIRTALALAKGEYCLVQDADLEYDVADYPEMLRAAAAGAPVVYGSRFLLRRWPEGMQMSNWIGNRILTHMANLLYGLHLTDEATGPKMFRTDVLRSLDLRAERFEFCSEVTAKLGGRKVSIVETPVRYAARSHAEGKKLRLRDGWNALWTLLLTGVRDRYAARRSIWRTEPAASGSERSR